MTHPAAHLLIVDDDERIRALLGKFLRKNDFMVTMARDATQARRLLAGLEFDLIVLDVMMPGLDGPSTFERLREDPEAHRAEREREQPYAAARPTDLLLEPEGTLDAFMNVGRLGRSGQLNVGWKEACRGGTGGGRVHTIATP